jgi:site-specific recombinase XerD
MEEYEEYEAECEKRKEENQIFLTGFEGYLKDKNLSQKTIDKHLGNIDFFINEFLLYEGPKEASDGVSEVSYFLGFWFIRKAMWASVTSIKENIAGLKHFYSYMHTIGQVTSDELAELKETIKEEKEEWIETLRKYDDPDFDMEDVWGERVIFL